MLLLIETPAGYSLFKVKKNSLVEANVDDIWASFETPESAQKAVQLVNFKKFGDINEAVEATTALIESSLDKGLKKFLQKNIVDAGLKEELAVLDIKLGGLIKSAIGVNVVAPSPALQEIARGIRLQLHELISDLTETDIRTMAISLSHSLNCFKLKFSPDKVDTMVVQAVSLLDDTDKNLNGLAMRLKEWYGWHFPELPKIVTDNLAFAKAVQVIGYRTNVKGADLSAVLHNDTAMEEEVKKAAEISMGTEITEEDLTNIFDLAKCVQRLAEQRALLAEYLRARMSAIAPNLTYMVGEIVGARLIAHAGNLMNLAKNASSTVQILGAEKALFRALKSKKATPKYGIIFHASLVGAAHPKLKGKSSRILAAKLALCSRVDALGDQTTPTIAVEAKKYVEKRLEELTNESGNKQAKSFARAQTEKYTPKKESGSGYNASADFTATAVKTDAPVKRAAESDSEDEDVPSKKQKVEKDEKKEKKDKKEKSEKKEKKEKKDKKNKD